MDREQAKQYIKEQPPSFLQPAKRVSGKQTYICPDCGSGSGKSGTGISPYRKGNTTRYKCFACPLNEDIIGLWKIHNGIEDDREAFKGLYQYYGITIDQTEGKPMEKRKPAADPAQSNPAAVDQKTAADGSPATDPGQDHPATFTDFFLQANKDITKTDYHRGISLETLNRYKVGYVEAWKHPKAPNAPASPRLIIPVSQYSYIARDTRAQLTKEQDDFKKQKVKAEWLDAVPWIFNRRALGSATQPIVVVEGELDALSIIDAGGEAVGLGSIANVTQFLEYTKEHKPAQPLVISLDNEDTPQVKQAVERLETGLHAQGITFYRHNVAGAYKDANDYLQADREAFTAEIAAVKDIPATAYREATAAAAYLQSFIDGIADSVNTPPISTGFTNLDKELDGGLYEGLYTIGAISSLGKTALIMQMTDQIAAAGHDVLIFSLEMARTELMARSISRHTVIDCIETGEDMRDAKTVRGITDYTRYGKYSKEERALIGRAITAYSTYAGHIFIQEGVGDIGVEQIREAVERHISFTGTRPIVVVDYLQLLAPANDRASDKQNTDKAVLELKRISRDHKLPVIAISSFNRMNYSSPAAMEAFKESGAIEYSSDVLFGLQLEGVGNKDFDVEKAKRENPRKVELVILKNRNGKTGGKVCFDYYAMFNYYAQGGAMGWDDTLSGLDFKKR